MMLDPPIEIPQCTPHTVNNIMLSFDSQQPSQGGWGVVMTSHHLNQTCQNWSTSYTAGSTKDPTARKLSVMPTILKEVAPCWLRPLTARGRKKIHPVYNCHSPLHCWHHLSTCKYCQFQHWSRNIWTSLIRGHCKNISGVGLLTTRMSSGTTSYTWDLGRGTGLRGFPSDSFPCCGSSMRPLNSPVPFCWGMASKDRGGGRGGGGVVERQSGFFTYKNERWS